MPKLRKSERTSSGEVPRALLDLEDMAWKSKAATLNWLHASGLDADPGSQVVRRLADGPMTRHKFASEVWAEFVGVVNKWGQAHVARLREMGVPTHGGDVAFERMTAAGVRVDLDSKGL